MKTSGPRETSQSDDDIKFDPPPHSQSLIGYTSFEELEATTSNKKKISIVIDPIGFLFHDNDKQPLSEANAAYFLKNGAIVKDDDGIPHYVFPGAKEFIELLISPPEEITKHYDIKVSFLSIGPDGNCYPHNRLITIMEHILDKFYSKEQVESFYNPRIYKTASKKIKYEDYYLEVKGKKIEIYGHSSNITHLRSKEGAKTNIAPIGDPWFYYRKNYAVQLKMFGVNPKDCIFISPQQERVMPGQECNYLPVQFCTAETFAQTGLFANTNKTESIANSIFTAAGILNCLFSEKEALVKNIEEQIKADNKQLTKFSGQKKEAEGAYNEPTNLEKIKLEIKQRIAACKRYLDKLNSTDVCISDLLPILIYENPWLAYINEASPEPQSRPVAQQSLLIEDDEDETQSLITDNPTPSSYGAIQSRQIQDPETKEQEGSTACCFSGLSKTFLPFFTELSKFLPSCDIPPEKCYINESAWVDKNLIDAGLALLATKSDALKAYSSEEYDEIAKKCQENLSTQERRLLNKICQASMLKVNIS
jgi:hypothetical protein